MYEDQNNNYVYYQASPAAAPQPAAPVDNQGRKKKKGGAGRFFRKFFACAGMGLCFGLCAAAGFYAVGQSTGMFNQKNASVASTDESQSIDDLKAWVNDQLSKNVASGDSGVLTASTTGITTSDATDVVEKVMPAMVSIVNNYTQTATYFGQPIEQDGTASGSGIIVGENDTELLIATNYHVIEDAKELLVHFIDDADVKAVVKGSDPDMDLAVIAVKLADMEQSTLDSVKIAKLGDSDSLKLGQSVIAIGNALGYGLSVTGGYVSALNREVELEDGSKGTFIQTDAAINPGNSGGALINMNGEVIGINSNKIGGTVVEGIGYAIPISAAEPILSDLMTYETREKVDDSQVGYLGIIPQSVTSDAAELYGMPEGVYISQVEDGTPAAEAGLLRGDIIQKLDNKKVSTADELREQLKYYSAGETIDVLVMRSIDGEYVERTVTVTLGERPQN
ncbi:serine protease HtrA family [Clostridium sp. CAG:510]|nr:serine protease HtrA family [Clostridium sp. CAG:510]